MAGTSARAVCPDGLVKVIRSPVKNKVAPVRLGGRAACPVLRRARHSSPSISLRTNSSEERSPVMPGAVPLRSERLGSSSSSGSISTVATFAGLGKPEPAG